MDFFVKLLYSALFGALAYCLFLILSKPVGDVTKPLLGGVLFSIAIIGIDKWSVASQFVPPSEVSHLITFDFALPVLYTLAKWKHTIFNKNIPQSVLESGLASTLQVSYAWLNRVGIFLLMGIYQLVVIWFLTWDYLLQARWH
jgi:hypothetical protein